MDKYIEKDANSLVSQVAYKFSEICGIYPITPSSPMAENVDLMASNGEENFFGNIVKVVEMQSEAGAIGVVHGSLSSGMLASTFTASQGLLLMIPSLYKLAGEMLPGVLHVASRSLSTQSLSIFGDHQDVYATRMSGVCMLSSSSVSEAYHLACVTHLSAIKSSLPFIHFFDGFRTSHEINKVKLLDMDKVSSLIDNEALANFRKRAMSCDNPTTRGSAENDDVYFQNMESRNIDYVNVCDIVNDYMNEINKITGCDYHPFNYYGAKDAEYVIVAMGSVCETIRITIDYLNSQGNKYGLICVHLFRPFSSKYLLDVLPKSTKLVAVIDRSKEPGSYGEALYLDVKAVLSDKNIKVVGGRYGLSSKNTNPACIKGIYDFMKSKNCHHNFTVGINDDVTNLSIPIDNNFHLPSKSFEALIYGYGSDGMVSTSKDIIKIIGNNTNYNAQGYFQYDSKKSGGVTRCHIRISEYAIRDTYYVDNPNLVVVSKDSYIYKYDILDNIKQNGILILNTSLSYEELIKTLPNKVKYLMAFKNIKLYLIDAYKLVNELGLKNKISTCMEVCIFHIINLISDNEVNSIMKKENAKRFSHKGNEVIVVNNNVVDKSLSYLYEVEVNKDWLTLSESFINQNNNISFYDTINLLKGNELPVSAFLDKKDGILKGGNSKYEKRDIANNVPCWNPQNCIQCNQCAFVCPHGVIRPYLVNNDDNNVVGIDSIMPKDKKYTIGISYKDCTGCGLCANVCPGKMNNKALTMEHYDKTKFKQETFDYLEENNLNEKSKVINVKTLGFVSPKFTFSGACAGCGETAYIKNLTQMFSDNLLIANATGCSSIYGASFPSTPYAIPWASSLFEDNAEYGLGIKLGIDLKREKIRKYMENNRNDLFSKCLDNFNDYDTCKYVYDNIDYKFHPYLYDLKDSIIPKTMWIIGGDGFAYDIGYGGLDHVISRGDNVNILVLDTEVYSNTGGQSSKSSNMGSIASFTSSGKKNYKKDLAKMAMCYLHVYVASVNIGYNKEQYLKVLKEASAYDGPSLIIAYSPCIEHGIKNGMEHSLDNARLAGECGYFLCFRYNPTNRKFILDSKNVDFDKYDEFLMTENRYANLKKVNKENASLLLEGQKEWAIERYNYYKKLDDSSL